MLEIEEALLEQVVDIAYQAAESILEVYEKASFGVEEKSDNSPVTEADLAAHAVIASSLAALDGAVPVLSEESEAVDFSVRKQWQQYWLVDPLDGTKEFIARNPEFTVNIALIQEGVPVLGVVLVPPTGMCYVGGPDLGARKKEGREAPWVSIQGRPFKPQEAFSVVASRRHGAAALEGLLERLHAELGAYSIESVGSALKMCLCADGTADLYPRLAPTCEWDTAAAQAVLEAAGGIILNDQGVPLRYNQKASLKNPHFFAIADRAFAWTDYLIAP